MTDNPKVGLDRSKTGRAKGTPNKTTALLKDAILQAATLAGGENGLVEYLRARAIDTPGPFLTLLGKVLPMQIAGDNSEGGGVVFKVIYEGKGDDVAS